MRQNRRTFPKESKVGGWHWWCVNGLSFAKPIACLETLRESASGFNMKEKLPAGHPMGEAITPEQSRNREDQKIPRKFPICLSRGRKRNWWDTAPLERLVPDHFHGDRTRSNCYARHGLSDIHPTTVMPDSLYRASIFDFLWMDPLLCLTIPIPLRKTGTSHSKHVGNCATFFSIILTPILSGIFLS